MKVAENVPSVPEFSRVFPEFSNDLEPGNFGLYAITAGTGFYGYGKCSAGDLNNISRETGLQFLHDDVGKATKSIAKNVKVPLATQEYDALTDFEFNTGALASSSLLTDLNSGLYASVPYKFLQYVYTHQTVNGKRVKVLLGNLVTRRSEEADLWIFGIYQVYGTEIGQLH